MSDGANFLSYLPEDIFAQILLKLPIKSLITCSCVCKTWNSIIKNPSFVSSHLDLTISSCEKNGNYLCLFQLCQLPLGTGSDSFFLRSNDIELSMRERLHFPYNSVVGFQVVASCNGLVCLMDGKFDFVGQDLILWNPVIRKSVIITNDVELSPLELVGLGFESRTGDYKVLTVDANESLQTSLSVNLYSLKDNSWKKLSDVSDMEAGEIEGAMPFLNGSLHFIALKGRLKNPRPLILGFDLSDEIFHELMLPHYIIDGFSWDVVDLYFEFHLFTFGESLAVSWLRDSIKVMEIWVMKEYGVQGSWTRLSTVRLDERISVKMNWNITGFVFREGAHVLLSVAAHLDYEGRTVYLHDLKSQETKKLKTVRNHTCFYLDNYVESLVLMDKGDDLSEFYETRSDYVGAVSGNNTLGNADLVLGTSSVDVSSSDESSDSE